MSDRLILRRRADVSEKELEPGDYLQCARGESSLAVLRCRSCKKLSAIARHIHAVDVMGDVEPLFVCPYGGCASSESLHLDEWVPEARASA